ncbi:hypothetical protein RHSIM_Rhsim06G0063700 [Rhododendron simsii]|uniref:Uncharacterized protein n=1 Tax=Rhododendron simsii TaxID=118357 RepID=A0A834GUM8_RHOSS|nr:hypothetical protein RHSIM_Rhsim06G0063700 [Rhododendron simsii]
MRKPNNQNRFIRLITLPVRVLTKARDLYVKSMINCAASGTYGASAMAVGSGQASSLPKSFSVNSSRSSNDGDDLRELIRAASARGLGSTSTGRAEMDLYLQHQMRRRSTASAATVVPRSCSVGMGRIDEDGPCEFGEESFGGRAELVYPRSRSYAVTKRSVLKNRFAAQSLILLFVMISEQKSQSPSDQGICKLRMAVETLVLFRSAEKKAAQKSILSLGFCAHWGDDLSGANVVVFCCWRKSHAEFEVCT